MVLVKNLTIFHVFISGKIGQENVFDDKKSCSSNKNKQLKRRKLGFF